MTQEILQAINDNIFAVWFLIGAVLMLPAAEGSSDIMGIIGTPGFSVFTDYANFSFSGFVFNLVFCATTATIVSGAMIKDKNSGNTRHVKCGKREAFPKKCKSSD